MAISYVGEETLFFFLLFYSVILTFLFEEVSSFSGSLGKVMLFYCGTP